MDRRNALRKRWRSNRAPGEPKELVRRSLYLEHRINTGQKVVNKYTIKIIRSSLLPSKVLEKYLPHLINMS